MCSSRTGCETDTLSRYLKDGNHKLFLGPTFRDGGIRDVFCGFEFHLSAPKAKKSPLKMDAHGTPWIDKDNSSYPPKVILSQPKHTLYLHRIRG
ncbi:hypothetical protein JTE90_028369 [Oedothorax gibbosus]|uniref:Uncharacterized protein n=1 Tax=Oedothorax gibbosus TaxID=931172 RepID=A0AAV6VB85_9ARAC|nr:hypothetical protein JTE90_028369 [Oedothorax gibbosus]